MKSVNRPIALVLLIVLALVSLGGCSAFASQSENELGLSDVQYNSLNMLNYLVALIQDINASQNDRLYLEQAYMELYDNINPESINQSTQTEITRLLDTMEAYRMIAVKRERLQYLYEQNRAQALKELVPDPMAVFNAVQSASLKRLVSSFIYMGVDSYTRYQSSSHEAETEFVKEGWTLDEEAAQTLHSARTSTFNYIVDMVRSEQLPGHLALSEKAVSEFVEWKNKPSNIQKIRFFEANRETYRAFGAYWLTLARCYYEAENYEGCLNAVVEYENLNISIFRRDYDYANILPMAIAAGRETQPLNTYITLASYCAERILANTENSDWALRYFAAQTYLELYGLTQNEKYLNSAYEITLNNVNYLVEEQKKLNQTYLAEVQLLTVPKDANKEQQREIKAYNEMLKQVRRTELPPVYEPLVLNCELLDALMDLRNIYGEEMAQYMEILHADGQPLFLCKPLDDMYLLRGFEPDPLVPIKFSEKELVIPAEYVSDDADISVSVRTSLGSGIVPYTSLDEWTLTEVKRTNPEDISSFQAVFVSEEAKKYPFKEGDVIEIRIQPNTTYDAELIICKFSAVKKTSFLFLEELVFERIE